MGFTLRRGLRYPEATVLANTLHTQIKNLADDIDFGADYFSDSSAVQRVNNLAMYQEASPNLPGYILIQTNLTFTNIMTRLHVKGYTYDPTNNIIDLVITFYTYSGSGTLHNYDVVNRGSFPISAVAAYKRSSDNKLAIVLMPDTPSNYWNYPKLMVDGTFAHTFQDPSVFKTGWSITRTSSFTGYTYLLAMPRKGALGEDTGWIAPSLLNGWINYGAAFKPAGYRRKSGIVYLQGLIQNGASLGPMFVLPAGFRAAGGTLIFITPASSAYSRIDVEDVGNVSLVNYGGTWVSLSGIQFPAEA